MSVLIRRGQGVPDASEHPDRGTFERVGAAFDALRAELSVEDAWFDTDEMTVGTPAIRRLAALADARIEVEL